MSGASNRLSDLALRLLHTTANSVASEQSFSVQNLHVTKLRNRLTVEHSEQLIFIYINSRVLAKTAYDRPSTEEVEMQEIEAENDLIDTCIQGSRVLGKRAREDEEDSLPGDEAGQALVGPLIL